MSRPFFEMKVVKVKGEKKKEYCPRCGSEIIMEKAVGNWVNGECIDKIKFPCFCSYRDFYKNNTFYGELDFVYFEGESFYRLRELKQAKAGLSVKYEYTDKVLNNLINFYNIHILKGKIIIFEEEE